jgi:Uma2 family endonuclease
MPLQLQAPTPTKLTTDTWIAATWDEYLSQVNDPSYAKAKYYYHDRHMRLETMPVSSNHALDNGIIYFAVNLFCMFQGISAEGLINCSYRKVEVQECQPDVSYYIGDRAQLAPRGNSIVDLDATPAPDLAIEVANTSLDDDLGQKRLLYEEMGIAEYWVVDVQNALIFAFAIANRGSYRIQTSTVLHGLAIAVLQEALSMSRTKSQSEVGNWLMKQFQIVSDPTQT